MTEPLARPPRKDPQARTVSPTLPPPARSRTALRFTLAAAQGRLALQQCADCARIVHPPREACPACLSADLAFRDSADGGTVIAASTVRTSTNSYFRERTPWRVGTVALDAGPAVIAHLHGDCATGDRVRMIARTDKAGQGVLMALPEQETPNMSDDAQLRELTCDPRHRRVLITDVRNALGQALAGDLSRAGAAIVFAGIAEDWRPFAGREALEDIANVEIVALDVTDTDSVRELAAEIGGKTDIVINTASHLRPGGIMDRDGIVTARDEMEINYFGLLRLLQGFGPAMRGRGADGVNSACAFVNILSAHALAAEPGFGSTSASHAAALALSQTLRQEFFGSGVKVVNVLTGPLEEDWRQLVPPPKVAPGRLSASIVAALQQGIEDVTVGPVAEDIERRWRDDPALLAREMIHWQAGPA